MTTNTSSASRPPLRLGVLGSGKGSNCQSLIDAIKSGTLNAQIVCVMADVKDAFILKRAQQNGIDALHLDPAPFKTKLDGEAEQRCIDTLRQHQVDYICLAGFMRMLKKGLLDAYPNRIINIHPSLLPSFPGLAAWKQALDYGVKVTGCTVHFVDSGMDTGRIIVQRTVPVFDTDSAETLHARIQVEEHIAYPEALRIVESRRSVSA